MKPNTMTTATTTTTTWECVDFGDVVTEQDARSKINDLRETQSSQPRGVWFQSSRPDCQLDPGAKNAWKEFFALPFTGIDDNGDNITSSVRISCMAILHTFAEWFAEWEAQDQEPPKPLSCVKKMEFSGLTFDSETTQKSLETLLTHKTDLVSVAFEDLTLSESCAKAIREGIQNQQNLETFEIRGKICDLRNNDKRAQKQPPPNNDRRRGDLVLSPPRDSSTTLAVQQPQCEDDHVFPSWTSLAAIAMVKHSTLANLLLPSFWLTAGSGTTQPNFLRKLVFELGANMTIQNVDFDANDEDNNDKAADSATQALVAEMQLYLRRNRLLEEDDSSEREKQRAAVFEFLNRSFKATAVPEEFPDKYQKELWLFAQCFPARTKTASDKEERRKEHCKRMKVLEGALQTDTFRFQDVDTAKSFYIFDGEIHKASCAFTWAEAFHRSVDNNWKNQGEHQNKSELLQANRVKSIAEFLVGEFRKKTTDKKRGVGGGGYEGPALKKPKTNNV